MKISGIGRINLSILSLCVTSILFASMVGLIPDDRMTQSEARTELSEAMATSITYLIANRDYRQVETQLELFARRNDAVISAGVRRHDGRLLASVGDHQVKWEEGLQAKSDGCFIVPIKSDTNNWARIEIQFEPLYAGINMFVSGGLWKLLGLLIPLVGISCWFHLKRILKYLDPTQVVPPRVRQTLDSFAEGVVLLDNEDRIVLANDAFSSAVDIEFDRLLGLDFTTMDWELPKDAGQKFPWQLTRDSKEAVIGATIWFKSPRSELTVFFSVNSSPVLDEAGNYQGVLVAFADVTPLEQKRAELAVTLEELHESKEEISKQNVELRFLATRDPLTGCINRRTFFEKFSEFWSDAKTDGTPMCAMMVDIDFFKSINDTYGHSMGDDVLRETGNLLIKMAHVDDVVCRYGGEEFAVLMPGADLDIAAAKAEAIRIGLAELQFPEFQITASLGLSEVKLGAEDPQELLDQADKCLYVAKRNGRNQVVRFDTVPEDLIVDESKISRTKLEQERTTTIPFPAVTALLSALSYRDTQTGAHSTRVSNYAALLAQRILSPREVYLVEIGGLLHDIGKIGVPDSILLKPGKLTEEEWKVMEKHDRIGVEIVNKSFKNAGLTEIIRCHHARYDGARGEGNLPEGKDIPVGARILTITDAFDAMVSDRPYRKGMSTEDALKELRRCAGTQFDPDLVEIFCEIIDSGFRLQTKTEDGLSHDVILNIGEQIERIVDAADEGDRDSFLALADRLRMTAEQSQVESVAQAATHAVEVASEDVQLEELVKESFELLAACRSMHKKVAEADDAPERIIEATTP